MRLSRAQAFSVARRAFAALPLRERAHLLGRLASCPYLRVLPRIPKGARVLDVGAGHGLFAALAIEAGAASVVALEPDLRKVLASPVILDVRRVAGFDDSIRGEFDVVTMFDVLYRIPLSDRDALFSRLALRVRPGGRILVKELDPSRTIKFAWNLAQEWVADHVLGLSLGRSVAYDSRATVAARLAAAGFRDFEVETIDAAYPHPHVLYSATRRG